MKKVLASLLIVGIAQGLSAEPTQYKHLHRLRNDSKFRIGCEQVNRALFFKGKIEKTCDSVDNDFDIYVQEFHKYTERNKEKIEKDIAEYDQEERRLFFQSSPKWQSFKDRVDNQSLQQINPVIEMVESNNNAQEKELLAELLVAYKEIRREQLSQLEQDMISRGKK